MFRTSTCLLVLTMGSFISTSMAQLVSCDSTTQAACTQESGCRWDTFTSNVCRNRTQGPCTGLDSTACTNIANSQCYYDGQCYLSIDDCTNSLTQNDCTNDCTWTSQETGYCTPDVINCFDFSTNQTGCNAQQNDDGSQACQFSTENNEYCGAYDPCLILPSQAACSRNPDCSWAGTCSTTNPADGAGLQDCTGSSGYDSSTCSQSPRDGTNVTTSCYWYTSVITSCNIYDPCSEGTTSTACSAISGCLWSGTACFSSDDGGNDDTQTTTCETFIDASTCTASVDSNGTRLCSWFSNQNDFGTCSPSQCRYGTESNCSSIQDCQWLGGIGSGAGSSVSGSGQSASCEYSPSGSGTGTNTCFEQATQQACEATDNCYYQTFSGGSENGFCGTYDPCSGLTQAECTSSSACSVDPFTGSCAVIVTTQAPDPNSCFFPSQINQSACEAKQRDANDPSTNPRCSYVPSISTYCSVIDPCAQYTSQSACEGQSGCVYENLDEQGPGTCYTQIGSGAGSGGLSCSGGNQSACESENGCEWIVDDNGYCTDWGLCVSGQSSRTVCSGITGCWWEAWGEGDADGFCNEGTAPPPTTASPTFAPVTPPPPTVFSCPDGQFQCTEVDRCIPMAYRCDQIDNDCPQNSDEQNCPSTTASPTTPRPCWSFEYECANRQCIAALNPRCNGITQCDDGSDEVGCPTAAPTPVPPPPTTVAPISARPTNAPTVTPECLNSCGNDISLLRRVERNPRYADSAQCRACLGGFSTITQFCNSNPNPTSAFCATGTDAPAKDVVAFFDLPSGVNENTAASAIRNALISSVDGLQVSDFAGLGVVSGPNADGSYRVTYSMASQAASDAAQRRLSAGGLPVSVNGESFVASGSTGGAPPPPPSQGEADDSDDNGMMIIIIIVAVVVVIGLVLIFIVIRKRKSGAASAVTRAQAKQTYMNPQYATAGTTSNTPPWADPNVPFITRAEAESQLKSRGMGNGDFVARQTVNTVQGYVITSCNQGIISNSQLKRVNGQLTYGGKPVGNTLTDAIATLQSKIKITPSNGPAYFLTGGSGGAAASVGFDDGEADA